MKILYFTQSDINELRGVSKKILSQVEAFNNLGHECILCYKERSTRTILRKIYQKNLIISEYSRTIVGRLFSLIRYNDLISFIQKNKIELIYIRYYKDCNPFFLKFLKNLKKIKVKIIIEIPTYPYDLENIDQGFFKKIFYFIEKHSRKNLKKYVDKIVTFSPDKKIYGIETIRIENGVDLSKVKKIKRKIVREKDEIVFVGVAEINFWHGYDRMINSIKKYIENFNKRNIKFYIVGNGQKKYIEELKKLVKSNELEDCVKFLGFKSGEELDEIYDHTDICVGCLGNHRKGITYLSPLKNREYCAKGLPIIFSEKDVSLLYKDFVYKVTEDESIIELEKIIKWYKNLKINSDDIRNHAVKEFSWDCQLRKVMENIINEN